MKGTTLLSLVLISQAANSISLHQRDKPATVGFSLERRNVANPAQRDSWRRKRGSNSTAAEVKLVNTQDEDLYFFNLTVGTPGQTITLGLDTGSSDMWVNSVVSIFCYGSQSPCTPYGTYDRDASSSYNLVNDEFSINYADQSGADGDYVTDTVKFGDVTLDRFQFGVGTTVLDSPYGVLGVGYTMNEAAIYSTIESSTSEYQNLPMALVKAGYIKSPAYSLWLDDLESQKGAILFGGVNAAKYIGDLHTVPIIPKDAGLSSDTYVSDLYVDFTINLSGMSLKKGNSEKNYNSPEFPVPVLLDSGSTLTYLPRPLVRSIYSDLNVKMNHMTGDDTVPCSLRDDNSVLTFNFADAAITVKISEMVLTPNGSDKNGPLCDFGITAGSNNGYTLGDTFLRSAYVVYDLGNNEISLANANFNPGPDKILEIGTGTTAVPKVPGATATPTPTSTASATGATGATGTTHATSKGLAPLATTNPKALLAGLAGGLLLAL